MWNGTREAGTTALVHSSDATRWWTFGGLYAIAALATGLKAHGLTAAPNNLAVRIAGALSRSAIEMAITAVRDSNPELLRPEVSPRVLDGLKFSVCLPHGLAAEVLQARMQDARAVQAVCAERLGVVETGN